MPEKPRWRWRMPVVSVRTRLIAVITLVAGLGMIAVGFVVFLEERQRVLADVDDLLRANLESARYVVDQGSPDTATWESTQQALAAVVQRVAPDDNTGVLGIIDGVPALVPGVALDVDLLDEPGFATQISDEVSAGEPVIGTYADNGRHWRYLATPIQLADEPSDGPPTVFTIVYDLDAELSEINSAARVWAIASSITLVVIAGAAGWVTTRLLRPLRQMRRTAERVSAQSLSERLPIEGRDDVSELAGTMNAMLDRLDAALESQRSLLSDVGHELKTPITIVRGHLEVTDADDPEDVRETLTLAIDELERMAQLVADLAASASLHGPSPLKRTSVDAADLARQIIRKAQGIEGAVVTTGDIADVVTMLDPARITQAVLQLAQNVVTHGGGAMTISTHVADDALEIHVRDYGPGVPDEVKATAFERFQRGPQTDAVPGSGLGLNIVQVIARAHGGSATVLDAPGGGADFVISLPMERTASAASVDVIVPPKPPLPSPREFRVPAAPTSRSVD